MNEEKKKKAIKISAIVGAGLVMLGGVIKIFSLKQEITSLRDENTYRKAENKALTKENHALLREIENKTYQLGRLASEKENNKN